MHVFVASATSNNICKPIALHGVEQTGYETLDQIALPGDQANSSTTSQSIGDVHDLYLMNPAATSHVSGSTTDLHAPRVRTNCTQHLQPSRQFGCTSLRLCSRQLHRARKHALETCLVAAVEAPSAASSSSSVEDEPNPHDLYKRFDRLLSQYEYSYKQGDRVKGTVFRVDQRAAYVDIGAKASASCPAEECSLGGVQRVCVLLLGRASLLSYLRGQLCSAGFVPAGHAGPQSR